jgi:integral membrane protein (TIGR01906 family)
LKIVLMITRWIFIVCVPLLLISSSLAWGFNSKWLYNYGFDKYDVSLQTGFSRVELEKAADGLIKYFNSNDEYADIILNRDGKSIHLFTREEQLHFKDVKRLVWVDYSFFIITFLLALVFMLFNLFWRKGKYRKDAARSLCWGCGLSILLILVIGIASYIIDFDQLFLQFHYLVFSNPYWSAEGYMLLLFPGGFWFDAALICGSCVAALALTLGAASAIYLQSGKKKL